MRFLQISKPYPCRIGRAFTRSFQSITPARVTRQNFRLLLDQILEHIQNADFVAFDTDLTGLHTASWRSSNLFDSCDTSYYKLKDSAENFAIWQFGVCPFKWMEAEQKFVAYPYSFCLFPRDELKVKTANDNFLCQTKSLEFLAKHGFDFNVCIHHGISHLSREQEALARMRMELQAEDDAMTCMFGKERQYHRGDLGMSPADMLFSNQIRVKLMHWRDTLIKNNIIHHLPNNATGAGGIGNCMATDTTFQNRGSGSYSRDTGQETLTTSCTIWYSSSESLSLQRASLSWASLAYRELVVLLEVLNLHFSDLVAVVQPEGLLSARRNVHVFYTASNEDKVLLMEELEQREKQEKKAQIAEAVGFRHVIDAVVASKKLVVGHHCVLDFVHIYNNFFGPLPPTTAKFTSSLLENFHCIVDTEYLTIKLPQLKKHGTTVLSSLYMTFFGTRDLRKSRVNVEVSDEPSVVESPSELKYSHDWSRSIEDRGKHDAGSNAYMAGCLFAHICGLTNTDPREVRHLAKLVMSGVKTGLARYTNLLCINFTRSSVLDLSTGTDVGETNESQRRLNYSNVALVWGYPCGTSPAKVQLLIKTALNSHNLNQSMGVFPVDESSAFVDFRCPEAAEEFFRLIQRPPKDLPHVAALLASGMRAARFAAYEFLCRSSLSMQRVADCAEALQLGVHWQGNTNAAGIVDNDALFGMHDSRGEKNLSRAGEVGFQEDLASEQSLVE